MNLERTEIAQQGFDNNCASLDPVPSGHLYMEHVTQQLRDKAEEAEVAGIFPDEADFVLGVLSMRVKFRRYDQEYADQVLLSYVQRYCYELSE